MRQCQNWQNHFVTILSPCAIWFVSPNRIWTDNTMNTAVASISCNWPDVTSANSGFHTNGKEFPQQCIAMTLHLSICSFDSLAFELSESAILSLHFLFYFIFVQNFLHFYFVILRDRISRSKLVRAFVLSKILQLVVHLLVRMNNLNGAIRIQKHLFIRTKWSPIWWVCFHLRCIYNFHVFVGELQAYRSFYTSFIFNCPGRCTKDDEIICNIIWSMNVVGIQLIFFHL